MTWDLFGLVYEYKNHINGKCRGRGIDIVPVKNAFPREEQELIFIYSRTPLSGTRKGGGGGGKKARPT